MTTLRQRVATEPAQLSLLSERKPCGVCGKAMIVYRERIARGRGKFCSRECSAVGRDKRRDRIPVAELFWGKVGRGKGCWLWRGYRGKNGYGEAYNGKDVVWAHRLSWTLANGPIPPKTCVCHKCDNPGCVRPSHLFLGTKLDNSRDAVNKGRVAWGERGNSRLTSKAVLAIRASKKDNASLAKQHGVSVTTIWNVRHRKSWARLA